MQKKKEEGRSYDTNFLKALAPMLVLSLLSEEPKYIYQMAVEISKRAGGKYEALALYPVVNRLMGEGFVEEDHQRIADNRVRNFYRITESGKEKLINMFSEIDDMLKVLELVAGREFCEKYKALADL